MMKWQSKDSKISSSAGESGHKKVTRRGFIHTKSNYHKSLRMLGPLTYGDYPEGMKRILGTRLPVFTKEESEQVKGSSDFVGVIHYLAASISNAQSQPSLPGNSAFFTDIGASLTCRNYNPQSF